MKILLVSADGSETDFGAMKAWLDRLGIPYDTLIATQTPLTAGMLSNGSVGLYQGIILTTGNLTYFNAGSGQWQSAFTDAEWATLWNYESDFGVRQVTSYTYPAGSPDSYGLNLVGYQDSTVAPLQATLTNAGRQVFPFLNAATPVTFRNAWVYLATVANSAVTTPLLVTPQGYAIASVTQYPDGRQNLAVTAANNPYLLHSELLSYGLINWVTKGVFIGQRHVNLDAQVDDVLIDDDIWDPAANSDLTGLTYRLTGSDYTNAIAWQARTRASNTTLANVRLELAFNGEGASGIYSPDTLTPSVVANRGAFNWVSHTYTHRNLDSVTYNVASRELVRNDRSATLLGLTPYQKDALVQPDISGLSNPQFLQAARDFGIKYLISDTSRPGGANPSPNTGFYTSSQPGILVVPRRPTNLFYNLATPAQFVSEYNYLYGPGGPWAYWPRDLTYSEIVDHESDALLSYLVTWDNDPLMFHQPNLAAYDGTHSLLGDLLDATFAKYRAVYNLPIRNLTEHDIGLQMTQRMAFNGSGLSGTLIPCTSITLTTTTTAAIPLTGVTAGTTEQYGGQPISSVQVAANAPTTVPLPGC